MLSGLVHAQGKADDDGKEVEQEANRSRVAQLIHAQRENQGEDKEKEEEVDANSSAAGRGRSPAELSTATIEEHR